MKVGRREKDEKDRWNKIEITRAKGGKERILESRRKVRDETSK